MLLCTLLKVNWKLFFYFSIEAAVNAYAQVGFIYLSRSQGRKTFFILNSTEHEIYHAHKC